MSKPKVSVVILHYSDTQGLMECLASLRAVRYENFDIILVHNGPDDGSLEPVLSSFRDTVSGPIYTGSNLGFAAGNNHGIIRALKNGADYVLLLNDDTKVQPDFIDLLVAEAENNKHAGIFGPSVVSGETGDNISFAGARFDLRKGFFLFHGAEEPAAACHGNPFETDFVSGCAMLVKKQVIEAAGLLDDMFFLYWEDADWCFRAKAAGYSSVLVPRSRIWHKLSASSGGNDSPLKAYHKIRGRLIFASRYARVSIWRVLADAFMDIAWLVFKSTAPNRYARAAAIAAGVFSCITRRKGVGPAWLTGGV